jgi:replicative DNA helicase
VVAGIDPDGIRDRRLQVEAVSQGLKELAMRARLPVLCASSLARPGGDRERRPTLSDLRESGELEHGADIVIFLHRDMTSAGTELIVAKNRDGGVGIVTLSFHAQTVSFREVSPREDPMSARRPHHRSVPGIESGERA